MMAGTVDSRDEIAQSPLCDYRIVQTSATVFPYGRCLRKVRESCG